MKSFSFTTTTTTSLLLALCCSVAVQGSTPTTTKDAAAAAVVASPPLVRKLQQNWADYEPWDLGTDVYYDIDEGYWGEITAFSNGRYTIKWKDDNEVEFFDDTDQVDEMVEEAAFLYYNGEDAEDNDPWAQGTDVYADEDGEEYWGQITAYRGGTYTTTWEDGEVEYYDDGEDLDDMVYTAYEKLTNFAAEDNFDPNTVEHNYKAQQYKIGTVVAHQVGNDMVMGTITAYDYTSGTYTIQWDNNHTDYARDDDLIHDFVANAADVIGRGGRGTDDNDNTQSSSSSSTVGSDSSSSTPIGSPINTSSSSSKDSRSGGAKFGIVVVVLVICIAGAVFIQRKFRNSKDTRSPSDLDLGPSAPGPTIT